MCVRAPYVPRLISSAFFRLLGDASGGSAERGFFGMRIIIITATAALLLGSGIALSLQAVRTSSQPTEAPQEVAEAAAAPTLVAAAEPTPFEFRQVRTVPIKETGTSGDVQAAPSAEADEDRPAETADTKAPAAASVPLAVAALPEREASAAASVAEPQEAVAPSQRPVTRAHRTSKRSAAVAKPSRRARRKAEVAAEPEPQPAALAFDGRNEYHSPFHSVGKILGGSQ